MYPHICVVLLTSRSQLHNTVRVVLMCKSLKNKEPKVKLELENRGKERRAGKESVMTGSKMDGKTSSGDKLEKSKVKK